MCFSKEQSSQIVNELFDVHVCTVQITDIMEVHLVVILQVKDLLSAPYDKCNSSLLVNESAAFLSLILTLIGLKVHNNYVEPLWANLQ